MADTNTYKIVVADDNLLFRQGLKRILNDNSGIEVIGEAGDGLGLLSLVNKIASNKLMPHLAIIDISVHAT